MSEVVAFWLAAVVLAAVTMPIAARLFARFPDGGAGLAFPLGLVLTSYAYFILRVARILPDGRGGFVLAAIALAGVAAWFAGDRRFLATLRRSMPGIVAAAMIFTSAFFGATALRSYTPDIAGTEQPMDFLYLNAVVNSPEYPPQDPWLAGERASYYYFGYIQAGALTELAGVPTSKGYNLALAYTFAASAAAIASLVTAVVRWVGPRRRRRSRAISAATAAVWMLLFCGSLVAVLEWFAAHGHASEAVFGALDAKFRISCALDPREEACYAGPAVERTRHWYPDQFWFGTFFPMTRVIPGTITEFPVFSFMLGDLHPHVTAIPLVLLTLGISASTYRGRSLLSWRTHREQPVESLLVALLFGALAFQNAWDVLTFSSVLGVAVFARNLPGRPLATAVRATAGYLGPLAGVGVIAFVPWYLDFSSQASGLYPYVGHGTSPQHVFLQWGPLIAASMLSLALLRRDDVRAFVANIAFTLWAPLFPFGAWAALAAAHGDLNKGLDERGIGGWITLLLLGSGVALLASAFSVLAARRSAAALAVGLAAVGVLLLYGSELLLIRDVFFGGVPRLNTVFKLSYQAWILLSVSGAVSLAAALTPSLTPRRSVPLPVRGGEGENEGVRDRGTALDPDGDPDLGTDGAATGMPSEPRRRAMPLPLSTVATGAVLALALLAGVYALTGWPNRTSGFENETSIDGLASLSRSDPAEYALIRWVEANVPPGATIVEATGRTWRPNAEGQPVITDQSTDYTDSGRVSARTGRPSPIGWYFHEIQWRGDTPAVQAKLQKRQEQVDRVYTAREAPAALAALRELDAEYVVFGHVEQFEYDPALRPPFEEFMDLVFASGDVRVYRLPVYKAIPTS